jgi:hypothetical protein
MPREVLNTRLRHRWLKPVARRVKSLRARIDEHIALPFRTRKMRLESSKRNRIQPNMPSLAILTLPDRHQSSLQVTSFRKRILLTTPYPVVKSYFKLRQMFGKLRLNYTSEPFFLFIG